MSKKTNLDRSAAGASLFKREVGVAQSLLRTLGTARALTVSMLLEYGEYDQISELSINPLSYTEWEVDKFNSDYQATALMQKNPRLPVRVNTRNAATRTWVGSERRCRTTNDRLRPINRGLQALPDELFQVIENARCFINSVLPPLQGWVLREIERNCRFGPGRTTSLSGSLNVRRSRKYSSRIYGCTPGLSSMLLSWPLLWRSVDREVDIQDYDIVDFVPKNSKTDRAISYPPCLAGYVQLGIGETMKRFLNRAGINLRDQSLNQRLAQLFREFCTVDLKSASDTNAIEAVRLLFRDRQDWFELMCMCRSDFSLVRGHKVRLSKFSAMGCGFTFELETLMFAALCFGASPSDSFSVYGDDIVCKPDAYPLLRKSLEFLGFEVNEGKTHVTGVFRESCGKDFFSGCSVRPFFMRKSLNDATETEILYVTGNSILDKARRNYDGLCRDARYLPAFLRCLSGVPPRYRYRIPLGYGDDKGFVQCKHERIADGASTRTFKFSSRPPRHIVRDELGGYVAILDRGNATDDTTLFESLRLRSPYSAPRRATTLGWPTLGPWV